MVKIFKKTEYKAFIKAQMEGSVLETSSAEVSFGFPDVGFN